MTPSSKLVVIPAPIHGNDMPRKMLRRLAGSPLLTRMIRIAESATRSVENVLVVTDDDEAALLAERMGCQVAIEENGSQRENEFPWKRIYNGIRNCEKNRSRAFDKIALLQPNAPLLHAGDVQSGEELLSDSSIDSVIAFGEQHREKGKNGRRLENPVASLGGAFAISKRPAISPEGFIGKRVSYTFIPEQHAFEIRSAHDWWVCEKLLAQKRIVFVVAGYGAIGMGHVYRAQLLAHEMMDHQITFLCTRESDLAARQLAANKFSTRVQIGGDLAAEVLELKPDVVINDFLDTPADYIRRLKAKGVRAVNIEDMGSGAAEADLVINALYEQRPVSPNLRVGPDFFCLRDEFLQATPLPFRPEVRNVLITFGGTDAPDLTRRIVELIFPIAKARGISLSIVTGPGYAHAKKLQRRVDLMRSDLIEVANGTKRISEYMSRADLAFSSAGRTVFELATMRVPAIILAANEREVTHTFASPENGLAYLGRHDGVDDQTIRRTFENLLNDSGLRRAMYDRMMQHDFRSGKKRVIDEILKVLFAQ